MTSFSFFLSLSLTVSCPLSISLPCLSSSLSLVLPLSFTPSFSLHRLSSSLFLLTFHSLSPSISSMYISLPPLSLFFSLFIHLPFSFSHFLPPLSLFSSRVPLSSLQLLFSTLYLTSTFLSPSLPYPALKRHQLILLVSAPLDLTHPLVITAPILF